VPHKGGGGPVQPSWRNDLKSGVGISTSALAVSRFDLRNSFDWFLEILSAAVFDIPSMCYANIFTLKCAEKTTGSVISASQ